MNKSELLSFILRGKNRLVILNSLKEGIKSTNEIEKDTKIHKTHIRRTLRELTELELIKCDNPNDRSYRFFELTETGKIILEKVNQIKK